MKLLCKGKDLLCISQDIFVFSEFYFDNSKENVNFAAMKKLFLTQLLALVAAFVMAVPVQRGQWKTIALADGTQVKVEAHGDEFCHFWKSVAGDAYVMKNNAFVKADLHELQETVAAERERVYAHRNTRFEKFFGHSFGEMSNGKKRAIGTFQKLEGVKKGLVMLVEFDDIHFTEEHTPEYYKQVLNEGGPVEKGYKGSVKQYFLDQSNDKFTVDFDVTPIIRMPSKHNIYTNDMRGIIRYAVDELKSNEDINWSQYDWDSDGEIDMVFVLYAGYGQATKADDTTLIWPHMSSMGYNFPMVAGKKIDTYACANELNWNFGEGDLDSGIGTFCHEFSHCLGYPDLYDVDYNCASKGITGMDYWDLLDGGSYNGNAFIPFPFSTYERMTAGWLTPMELEAGKEYSHLRPISDKDGGDSYVMTNPSNPNEMYVFEAIQNAGWASGLYGAKGLLVIHIDYKESAWKNNVVNCARNPSINDISRHTYVPADGNFIPTDGSQIKTSMIKGDLYPYKAVNCLELRWNKADAEGNLACPIKITDIVINSDDNTVSFVTKSNDDSGIPEGALYYESFNKCAGIGGNDNIWLDVTTLDFRPDNSWTSSTGSGANKCAMFGSATQAGIASTADIKLEPGDYVLQFKAGRYDNEVPKLTVSDATNTTTVFGQTSFDLAVGQWTECETTITLGEKANIRFRALSKGRWFLDEVAIVKPKADAIDAVKSDAQNLKTLLPYNLNGQKVGADYRGIVIKNGKKYLAK